LENIYFSITDGSALNHERRLPGMHETQAYGKVFFGLMIRGAVDSIPLSTVENG